MAATIDDTGIGLDLDAMEQMSPGHSVVAEGINISN
jgi:hypothetical protein